MARRASRDVIEALGAFLRRCTALSEGDVEARMKDLAEGRMRAPDMSSEVFRRPHASRHEGTSVRTDATKTVIPERALVAADVPADEVRARITSLTEYVTARLQAGELPHVDLPDLHRVNGIYDERGNVFLGHHVRRLVFDRRGGKAFMRLLLTLEAASENLRSGVFTTKRGLYYFHQAKLPDEDACQVDSDRALAALAGVLGVRRRNLGFVEARRGILYGGLVIRDGGHVVDLSKVGPSGYGIPRFTDDAEIVSSDAAFILVVEKHSVAARLAQVRWWESARCILMCGEGCPSLSMREYVRSLVDTLGVPAYVLADADPSGIGVALTYAHGSISTALETPWLACSDVRWVGGPSVRHRSLLPKQRPDCPFGGGPGNGASTPRAPVRRAREPPRARRAGAPPRAGREGGARHPRQRHAALRRRVPAEEALRVRPREALTSGGCRRAAAPVVTRGMMWHPECRNIMRAST